MKTDIIVVGGGGREHALIKALKKSPEIGVIYALPGNGGMAADAICVPEIGAKEIDKIVAFATSHNIGFAVVAPDDPLVLGCADALMEAGIPTFGPRKNAAIIEGSKVFSKNLMKKYGIPTAAYETFEDAAAALAYVQTCAIPTVVKADGLALGKGVIIAMTREEAVDAVRSIMEDKAFGESGSRIVIEEFLTGPEVSVLSFTDGKTVIPMISSMDHKRIGDNDTGLNTGGMGTIAPNPYYTDEIADVCMKEIFLPTVRAMEAEGRPFAGCLYFGLMLTPTGPKVIEYNLFTIMKACAAGTLTPDLVKWKNSHACCVVLASSGYPVKYQSGFEITVQNGFEAELYVAGAKLQEGKLLTAGGRVLGVTAVSDTLENAIALAYKNADLVSFEGAYRRSDIGQRALAAGKSN